MKVVGLGLLLVLLLLGAVPQAEDKVVFLDVGQGAAILLQDGTQQVLIDGGPGMTVLTRLGEEMPFFDRRIEVVILTHPERDHVEGLLHVLDRYEVGLVLLPKIAHTSQMQEVWLERIINKSIDYRFALNHQPSPRPSPEASEDAARLRPAGVGFRVGLGPRQRVLVGDIVITVLGPFDSEAARAAARASLNNASVITRVDFAGLSFLLTGDAEKRVEKMLVENTSEDLLDVEVLKAGHHGSKTSTNKMLVDKSSPSAAVISVGADNKFGHPHPDVLERLEGLPVWRTDEDGSVRFKLVDDERWIIDVDG